VQIDARRANVAGARPVPVPEVRPAVSGLLARAFTGPIARTGTPT